MNKKINQFIAKPFSPPFWLRNGHLQTILPKLLAPQCPNYRRQLAKDSLNESDIAYDFYDVKDDKNADNHYKKPLVVLFHGMEGDSSSHYARMLAYQVHQRGWHFVVPHFRSCGGVAVSSNLFYNAGDTAEVHHSLSLLAKDYQTVFAVGVSLGGNVLAKYLADYGKRAVCQSAVIASAPVDLASAAIAMERFISRKVYTPYLLNSITAKALANNLKPQEIQILKKATRISEFDRVFTAPRSGYRSAYHYYHQASSLPNLIHINKPTLMISAQDDPFLGLVATANDVSQHVQLINPTHGGHIGFISHHFGNKSRGEHPRESAWDLTWFPQTVSDFFQAHFMER